ncbi:hypothetical protein [Methylobacillus sp. MM3]|uniref:hypothetical protein n=1 Tax=Methylobacillus sp. MM3 TaxID=1848039 RepID=UPI0010425190|nr:hypothetical protein [Methylobacillus sp. MM3]
MNSIAACSLGCLCFISSLGAYAEGFQSYEAGTYPIRARIEVINKTITDIESSLKAADLSPKEKELLDECLRQYATEKKQLEADLEAGRKLNQSGLVNYLSADTEQECASLTHHSSGTPNGAP